MALLKLIHIPEVKFKLDFFVKQVNLKKIRMGMQTFVERPADSDDENAQQQKQVQGDTNEDTTKR